MANAWAIDVGQSSIKVVKMAQGKGRIQILKADIYEHDAFLSEEKETRDEELQNALSVVVSRNKISSRDMVAVSIPGQAILSRFFHLPSSLKDQRLRRMVEEEAKMQIPFDMSEVLWDWQIVNPNVGPGEEYEIGLFAIRQDILDGYIGLFDKVGIEPDVIQTSNLALLNLVRYEGRTEIPSLVLSIGADSSDLIIVHGEHFQVRPLKIAGDDITKALQKKFACSHQEGEELKRKSSESKQADRMFSVMQGTILGLVNEIQRSVGFYKSRVKDFKAENVLAFGNSFKLSGLAPFLSERTGYEVKNMETFDRITPVGSETQATLEENYLAFGVAIGLGLQILDASSINVNLMRMDDRVVKAWRRKGTPLLVGAALMLVAVLLLWFKYSSDVKKIPVEYNKPIDVKKLLAENNGKPGAKKPETLKETLSKVAGAEPVKWINSSILTRYKTGMNKKFEEEKKGLASPKEKISSQLGAINKGGFVDKLMYVVTTALFKRYDQTIKVASGASFKKEKTVEISSIKIVNWEKAGTILGGDVHNQTRKFLDLQKFFFDKGGDAKFRNMYVLVISGWVEKDKKQFAHLMPAEIQEKVFVPFMKAMRKAEYIPYNEEEMRKRLENIDSKEKGNDGIEFPAKDNIWGRNNDRQPFMIYTIIVERRSEK